MDSETRGVYKRLISSMEKNQFYLSNQLILKLKQTKSLNKRQLVRLFEYTESRNISSKIRQLLITELIQPIISDLEVDSSHPLWICVHCGDFDSIKVLLDNNTFDLNAFFLKNHVIPILAYAVLVSYKYPEICIKIVDLLLNHGADINVQDVCAENVFHKMILWDCWNTEIANYLFEKGASVQPTVEEFDRSLLRYAVREERKDAMEWLLDHGVDVNETSRTGRTALSVAVLDNNESFAKFLLQRGADVNQNILFVETVLHVACSKQSTCQASMVKLLIEFGATINTVNYRERTPFQEALFSNEELIVMFLIKEFAKIKFKEEIDPSQEVTDLASDLQLVDQDPELKEFHNNCLKELRKMHSTILYKSVSFYESLVSKTSRQLALLLRNEEFRETVASCKMKKSFPLYKSLLNDKIKAANEFKKSMDELDKKLYSTIGHLFPDVVMRIILKFLYRYELGF